ncbi:Gfo/Idh/MocA family oxidoreductase [Candidatus Bathyarchaeota archaeon]|nr:MAG: Gfo/Idh/MocA family oxidoreductase [Candidatus Bathyarchaeota archaeon]
MNPVRVAVIGAGYWGKKVIREIREVQRNRGGAELHSVVDNSPTMLSQCQQEFGPLDYRVDYHSLLTDPNLHAVHICTPNASHFEVASAFLRHGKNVLVEKPLTLKSQDAYSLVKLAKENHLVLCTGHIHRFNNGVKEMRKAIASGELGELYYLRFRWTGFMLPQGYREVITDLAPHPFDICNYLLDIWPNKITCRGKGYRTKDNEEVAFMTAEHAGELAAQVEVSWLDREKRRDVTIVGSKGMAFLDCSEQKGTIQGPDGSEPRLLSIVPSNTLRAEVNHFVDCIADNRDARPFSNLSDGVLGARVVSILEAARESLRNERTMQLQIPRGEEILAK